MRLVHKKTGEPVKAGDKITSFRGEEAVLVDKYKPDASNALGRVYVRWSDGPEDVQIGFYPSVFGLEWVDREDR